MLCVKELSIKYKDSMITQNISFSVEKGQVLGISGESGSGKTLTCRALMNLLNLNVFNITGKIKFKNKNYDYSEWVKSKNNLKAFSMIMQNPMTAFDPVCKIERQMVETIKKTRKITREEVKLLISEKLEAAGLKDVKRILNSYPYMLSGGMLQRIMIVLSLAMNPEVIVADEPTTALDVCTQRIILDMLETIRKQGIPIILVTHDFGVLSQLADHVLILNHGIVEEAGETLHVFNSPKSKYTERLLEASFLRREYQC